jgi:hypothetical protein
VDPEPVPPEELEEREPEISEELPPDPLFPVFDPAESVPETSEAKAVPAARVKTMNA